MLCFFFVIYFPCETGKNELISRFSFWYRPWGMATWNHHLQMKGWNLQRIEPWAEEWEWNTQPHWAIPTFSNWFSFIVRISTDYEKGRNVWFLFLAKRGIHTNMSLESVIYFYEIDIVFISIEGEQGWPWGKATKAVTWAPQISAFTKGTTIGLTLTPLGPYHWSNP